MVNDLFKKNVITREYEALINNINSLEPDLKLLTDTEILTKSNISKGIVHEHRRIHMSCSP